jgi:quercetin dioxygenase-like cupin family protein
MNLKNKKIYNWNGRYEEGLREKKCAVIHENEFLELVIGEKNKYLYSVFYSDKEITFGKMVLTSNKYTEIESHDGDEAIYVLKGRLLVTVFENEEQIEDRLVIQHPYKVESTENMLIPAGFKHLYKNLYNESIEALIVISPKL